MKTTLKTLSALAIAAATLTAVTLATGSTASANPFRGGGHGPVVLGGSTRRSVDRWQVRQPSENLLLRVQPATAASEVELLPLALPSVGLLPLAPLHLGLPL